MRIGERLSSQRETTSAKETDGRRKVEQTLFLHAFRAAQRLSSEEEMDKLLQKLDEQGKRLVHSRTLFDLKHYKKLVSQVLEHSVGKSLALSERRTLNREEHPRVYRLVEKVHTHLVQLTDEILKRESSRLDILEQVGQIKGLLIQINA